MAAGEFTTNDTSVTPSFVTVTFSSPFDVVPVVVSMPTGEGSDPATLRIRNVSVTGFEVAAVEPTGSNGTHPGMTASYVAVEPGVHEFADGTKIAAGTHSTTTMQSKFAAIPSGWDTVNFGTTLSGTASVAASLQTTNSESPFSPATPSSPFLSVATRTRTASSIRMAIERSEDTSGTVSAETIGWVAFPAGQTDSFDVGVTTIHWDARVTPDTVAGWGNGCKTYTFSGTAWPDPLIVGVKNRRDGVDGGWVRRCSLSGSSVELAIDEDQANDSERNHTTESVSLLSFSEPFFADFRGEIEAVKTVVDDPSTYALPGNEVTYKVDVKSVGLLNIDSGAIVFVDNLPSDVELKVADIGAPGSGPVKFTDGSPSSALTYNFISLSSMSDDVDFSNDGGTSFTYVPTANGVGTDPNVTHLRFTPQGSFPAHLASGDPKFSIEFDVRIK